MKKEFYSNGKLLITGEYLVLDGGIALALPTKFGQNLIVETGNNQEISWRSFDSDGSVWFEDSITFEEIKHQLIPEKESVKNTLIKILREAYVLNPNYLNHSNGYNVTTQLTFPRNWGLGTSSTLLNNIAQWTQIDAFELLKNSFGGSGYDIACAQNDVPILYHLDNEKPVVEKVSFEPKFSENLYFVYLNKKQSSKTAIAAYHKYKNKKLEKIIIENNKITLAVLNSKTVQEFSRLIDKHEAQLSVVLEIQTVKENLFPDFKGVVKSLGAWGGDFVMVISKENPIDYFMEKGFSTLIPYKEMIL